LHSVPELIASIFIIPKEVETRASRREQHNVASLCEIECNLYQVFNTLRLLNNRDNSTECLLQLLIVFTKADQSANLLPDIFHDQVVVISFINPTCNPDQWSIIAAESIYN